MVTVGSILSETFAFMRANVRSIAIWSGGFFLASLLPVLGDMFHPADPEAARDIAAWQVAHYGTGLSVRFLITALAGAAAGGFGIALQAGMTAVATRELLDAGGGTAEKLLAAFE